MSIARRSTLHEKERAFTLAVNRYDEGLRDAVLYHADETGGILIRSFRELIDRMEQFFAEMNYPKETLSRRSIGGAAAYRSEAVPAAEKGAGQMNGRTGTFSIRVSQRQHASWQGTVRWLEKNETYHFPSFMDLVRYMDECLRNTAPERNGQAACTNGRQMTFERCLKMVAESSGTVKILPDTLVFVFRRDRKKMTFMVKPMFYEYSTCQGVVYWKECRMQVSFRSLLEAAAMMNNAALDSGCWNQEDDVSQVM